MEYYIEKAISRIFDEIRETRDDSVLEDFATILFCVVETKRMLKERARNGD